MNFFNLFQQETITKFKEYKEDFEKIFKNFKNS